MQGVTGAGPPEKLYQMAQGLNTGGAIIPQLFKSLIHRMPVNSNDYVNHIDEFDSVFYAAAIGQYLGGIDTTNSHGKSTVGFVNE